MNYKNLINNNSNFLKRFSHNQRFQICIKILKKYYFKTILDFGSGNGELLKQSLKVLKYKSFYAFEPNIIMFEELKFNLRNLPIKKYNCIKKISNIKFDIICINEVFEHLNNYGINQIFKILKNLINPKSKIIISIPIETGFGGLMKNLIRIYINQTHKYTSIKSIIFSFFGFKIIRPSKSYNDSHIGFDYIKFIKLLEKKNMKILNITYSPFPSLGGAFNSQVYLEVKI